MSAPVILNQQDRVRVNLRALRDYLDRVQAALRIRSKQINVCLIGDGAMRRLNRQFRGKPKTTDVLSFPWSDGDGDHSFPAAVKNGEFRNFLGDVVISAGEAARNARMEGHAVGREIEWLILHGTLHLLGYDHETDNGEMVAKELQLRERLGVGGTDGRRTRRLKAVRQ